MTPGPSKPTPRPEAVRGATRPEGIAEGAASSSRSSGAAPPCGKAGSAPRGRQTEQTTRRARTRELARDAEQRATRSNEPREAPATPDRTLKSEKQNSESPEVAPSAVFWASWEKSRRRPTLPHGYPCSTIGSEELNFRVRDGIGCGLFEITTGNCGIRRDRAMRRCERGGPESVPSLLALVQIRLASRILHVTNTAFRLEDTFDATIHSHSRERELERLATLEGILDVCLRDMAKPHDLLVPVSSVPCSTSTPGLSTS